MELDEINEMATKHGWKPLDIQESIGLASFSKTLNGNPARINVYMTKMTVATCLTHPKQGKTQLFRKRVGKKLMNKIFENPRVHTQQGYKRKN